MNSIVVTMALLMGLTGSVHCAGMCGPIIWIMPFQMLAGARKAFAIALYHAARISVYALFAIILHAFKGLFQPAIQQYISIILGSLLLIAGFFSFVPGKFKGIQLPWSGFMIKQFGKFMHKPGYISFISAGLLNGMLPCGLVYMALSATISLHDNFQVAAFMVLFGLGTVPMLVAITILKHRLSFLKSPNAKRWVPVVMLLFGSLLIVRGMDLGIPYLSPKVVITQQHTIKASCCHRTNVQPEAVSQ